MQVNGRSVKVQLMRKLLAGRFVWDVEFPSEFRDNFIPHFAQEKTDLFEGFIVKNAIELFKCACRLNLEECHWSDLTLVNFLNSFKHFSVDDDEPKLLLECYKALYSNKEIELSSSIARKYSNVMLGTEKFGSKMDCRNLRSARIMASWSADDGSIDTSVPKRPGIVNFYRLYTM